MANDNRPPPLRPTSKFSLQATRWVAGGSSTFCGIAFGLGTYPDAIASTGPLGFLIPFGVAAVAAAGLTTGWHNILGIGAHAKETHKQALAMCLGTALTVIGFATSGWFLASKIGGASALQAHQLEYVQKLQGALATAEGNAAADQKLVGAMETGGNAMRATAEAENNSGILSGTRGKSVVYQSVMNLADSMSALSRTLATMGSDRDEQLMRARHDLDDANRAAAARDETLFEEAVSRANNEIGTADKTHLTAVASGLGLGLVVSTKARTVVDTTLADINKMIRSVSENRRDVPLTAYAPIGAKEAVILNPPVLAWIAALLIETLPLIMLGVLLVLWREHKDDDVQPDSHALPAPAFARLQRAWPAPPPAE